MSLLYDVTYFREGKLLPDLDTNVTASYLDALPRTLAEGETAHARCTNGPRSADRDIDAEGVHKRREI